MVELLRLTYEALEQMLNDRIIKDMEINGKRESATWVYQR